MNWLNRNNEDFTNTRNSIFVTKELMTTAYRLFWLGTKKIGS